MGTAVSALTVTETGLMGARTSQRRHFVAGPFGTVTLPNHLRLMLNNNKKAQLTQREARDSLGI